MTKEKAAVKRAVKIDMVSNCSILVTNKDQPSPRPNAWNVLRHPIKPPVVLKDPLPLMHANALAQNTTAAVLNVCLARKVLIALPTMVLLWLNWLLYQVFGKFTVHMLLPVFYSTWSTPFLFTHFFYNTQHTTGDQIPCPQRSRRVLLGLRVQQRLKLPWRNEPVAH